MEDVRISQSVPALLALAVVVRQFDGSRIERQVLAQAFDLVWQVERDAVSRIRSAAARSECVSEEACPARVGAPRNRSRRHTEALVSGGSEKGGAS